MWLYCACFVLCVTSSGYALNQDTSRLSQGSIRGPPQADYYIDKTLPDCQNCECGERNEEPRVVGGLDSSVNAFPWLARLIYQKAFGCGASLINNRYVVSAAHCVIGFMWFMFRVTLGEHNRCATSRPETFYVVKVVAHNFSLKTLSNDISLLRLSSPVTYSHVVRPVCLPKNSVKDYVGATAVVAGWGATAENGKWSCTLLEAELPVLSNEVCRHGTSYNATKIQDAMMCAGYPATAHKDACTGDSGGPLVTENENHTYDLIGVVSWGYGCARKGYPGVYTRVTEYMDWIRENTYDGCFCKY